MQARAQAAGLATTSGAWNEVTTKPYNSDDLHYADPEISNAGGGSGYVSGTMTALALDGKYVYAGAADGGVWRSIERRGHLDAADRPAPQHVDRFARGEPEGSLGVAGHG